MLEPDELKKSTEFAQKAFQETQKDISSGILWH